MNIIITGRKIDITSGLRDAVTKKLSKLEKFFGDEAEAKVTLSVEKGRHTVEVTIFNMGMFFRAEETSSDMYASIDKVCDIIDRQIRKNKTRLEKKLRASAFTRTVSDVSDQGTDTEESEIKIVKTKRHSIKPMSAEEAVLQMELLGHEFFIFQNDKTGETNIVYKRRNSDYGLIEAE
jgi:putative sigma-54 modulation protein